MIRKKNILKSKFNSRKEKNQIFNVINNFCFFLIQNTSEPSEYCHFVQKKHVGNQFDKNQNTPVMKFFG